MFAHACVCFLCICFVCLQVLYESFRAQAGGSNAGTFDFWVKVVESNPNSYDNLFRVICDVFVMVASTAEVRTDLNDNV